MIICCFGVSWCGVTAIHFTNGFQRWIVQWKIKWNGIQRKKGHFPLLQNSRLNVRNSAVKNQFSKILYFSQKKWMMLSLVFTLSSCKVKYFLLSPIFLQKTLVIKDGKDRRIESFSSTYKKLKLWCAAKIHNNVNFYLSRHCFSFISETMLNEAKI